MTRRVPVFDAGGEKCGNVGDDCENAVFHQHGVRILSPQELGKRHQKLSSERTGEVTERKECCQTRVQRRLVLFFDVLRDKLEET